MANSTDLSGCLVNLVASDLNDDGQISLLEYEVFVGLSGFPKNVDVPAILVTRFHSLACFCENDFVDGHEVPLTCCNPENSSLSLALVKQEIDYLSQICIWTQSGIAISLDGLDMYSSPIFTNIPSLSPSLHPTSLIRSDRDTAMVASIDSGPEKDDLKVSTGTMAALTIVGVMSLLAIFMLVLVLAARRHRTKWIETDGQMHATQVSMSHDGDLQTNTSPQLVWKRHVGSNKMTPQTSISKSLSLASIKESNEQEDTEENRPSNSNREIQIHENTCVQQSNHRLSVVVAKENERLVSGRAYLSPSVNFDSRNILLSKCNKMRVIEIPKCSTNLQDPCDKHHLNQDEGIAWSRFLNNSPPRKAFDFSNNESLQTAARICSRDSSITFDRCSSTPSDYPKLLDLVNESGQSPNTPIHFKMALEYTDGDPKSPYLDSSPISSPMSPVRPFLAKPQLSTISDEIVRDLTQSSSGESSDDDTRVVIDKMYYNHIVVPSVLH